MELFSTHIRFNSNLSINGKGIKFWKVHLQGFAIPYITPQKRTVSRVPVCTWAMHAFVDPPASLTESAKMYQEI
jgi:hypothetical protein